MNKKLIIALLLIALCVIIFIVNRGSCSINLLFTTFSAAKAIILLGFTAVGVAIGLLLK